ncbi:hypothetical protein GCM10007978_49960 [Shewanella hanedai]|uniref:hypothetical protein n=1 Tax=Shewanella hanedai TaxID=25 RepID=UPI00166D7B93|nr:hypothetical protein [Shewanella hanedai]GGJ06470.1 hypothetical protein GCM10007978_49960 [Shewanella hanedai]
MKNALSKKEKELYKRIARILWKDWDPIGVYNEEDEWDDEYDSYVPSVFKLAIENHYSFKISSHLTRMASDNMGLSTKTGNEHDLNVANIIIQAKREILGE